MILPYFTHRVIAAAIKPQYASQTAGLKHLSHPSFYCKHGEDCHAHRGMHWCVRILREPRVDTLFPTRRFMINTTPEKEIEPNLNKKEGK